MHTLLSAQQAADRRADLELNQDGILFRDILTSEAQVNAAKPLRDVPLVVISHGVPQDGGPGCRRTPSRGSGLTYRAIWPG